MNASGFNTLQRAGRSIGLLLAWTAGGMILGWIIGVVGGAMVLVVLGQFADITEFTENMVTILTWSVRVGLVVGLIGWATHFARE